MSPVGAVAAGVAASAAGTLAMDLALFGRYRSQGGRAGFVAWELSSTIDGWEDAPAPAQVGRRLVEGLFMRELPASSAALTNNLTHWGYGLLGGAQYGVVAGSLARSRARHGLVLGTAVWLAGYAVLPLADLYDPIWEYDRRVLAEDLGAHLVFGLSTAAVFAALRSCPRAVRVGPAWSFARPTASDPATDA